jgi:hypothetical protein
MRLQIEAQRIGRRAERIDRSLRRNDFLCLEQGTTESWLAALDDFRNWLIQEAA